MPWLPPPEPVTWTIAAPITHAGVRYDTITLRSPTGEDVMKATAVPGSSGTDQTHRLVEAVSGVPYEVIRQLPWWQIQQMSAYFDDFVGAPSPDPLEQWRKARVAAPSSEASAS